MEMLSVLLFMSGLRMILQQSCSEIKMRNWRRLKHHYISCFTGMSIERCALECLLVKSCKSFNHVAANYWCELNSVRYDGSMHLHRFSYYTYNDIEDWPQGYAGTCASRPCTHNQRCIPSTPYRCISIDCGTPPVAHIPGENSSLPMLPSNTSLGAKAQYTCPTNQSVTDHNSGRSFPCYGLEFKLCNSDSSWTLTDLYCK